MNDKKKRTPESHSPAALLLFGAVLAGDVSALEPVVNEPVVVRDVVFNNAVNYQTNGKVNNYDMASALKPELLKLIDVETADS